MSLQPPSVSYTYHIQDAQCFWSIHDDSINVHDFDDNTVTVTGVTAKHAFYMARNMLCAKKNVFDELPPQQNFLDMAKDMVIALGDWVTEHETKDAKQTMKG